MSFPILDPPLNEKRQLTNDFHDVPAGSKLLRSDNLKGEGQTEKKFVFGFFLQITDEIC